jgi:tetratricopeptide (TPR) repeat protein
MLVTSASRGALLGLAALAVVALLVVPIRRRKTLAAGLVIAGLGLALAHPRTRALFAKPDPAAAPNISNVQRTAMLTAAWRMGLDRPLLGWGPGTTPLAYPRYRAGLDGGAENVLQLHCTPAQLWAELGAAGVAVALAFVVLTLRAAPRHPTAAATLAGYAVFALTDWQLDVPVFALAVALCAALIAPPGENCPAGLRRSVGVSALGALAIIALLGRSDPAPAMNVRALALAREPANAERAIALLRDSLAFNPDQEIAHFNLGWLLVGRDPAAAERHFLAAARLVPDKGGVYFGLGLARLNQNQLDAAARAFALECLNDPAFLASPWWREPAIAAQRAAVRAEFSRLVARAGKNLRAGSWAAAQLSQVAAFASLPGDTPPGPERRFFRERTGYPVLMRNLDLAAPTDLFLVRESASTPAARWPAKGWLPSPLLLVMLDAPAEK